MNKYIRVLKELIRLRFQKLMMFRIGFFGPFFVDGSMFAVELIVFQAVYSNINTIGNWGRGEMIIYIGSFSLLNAVNMVVYFFGVIGIPEKIKNGHMDIYLTKPISPLFRITFEGINPGSIPLVVMSIFIIAYGIKDAHVVLRPVQFASYMWWMFLMQILYYDVEVIIRSVSFFFVSCTTLDQLEGAGIELCMKLPGIAFYGIYKVIFYCILPYGIMATLPVQSMIGEMTVKMAICGCAVLVSFTGLTYFLWANGIKHYNSVN